ncbi:MULTISPECIES: CPBP family intramembrane glutamic endopeptidase [Staphylococcus intermedius group]|uniref:Caax amino protease family n=1 Tax=Staphylococcus intermedius NCTC 11048 TaxID=1141106 RepID=A0A380FZY2_STAIN|nr:MULTISPECIES: type II CAAX endopeptidase family protein [Staphylococcus intermedius group]PCF61879.1 CPBP family intramembrane metalloprotease [Staphylococcus intermedius]PCF77616.1 CPBP family intramembrane metalloprotease [Staphylococcus intermedius]PCF77993.1 CPBP family intramembrane metalloprotease [Staphylococcus intermedius]PCF82880.1 CPBP family intramembrane metalloprotease [Staphylococcus delphini]PCF83620.1 CPBP family intramembrane metalloprotease [Staphylococcus intermedius]
MYNKINNLNKGHYLALLYIILLVIIPKYGLLPFSNELNWNYDIVNEWYFFIITTILMIYAIKIFKVKLYDDWLKVKNKKIHIFLIGVLGFFLILCLNVILILIINQGKPVKSVNQDNIESVSFLFKFFMPLLLIIIGPILEELLFRVYILDFLKDKVRLYPAILISIISFTAIHMHSLGEDWKTLVPYFSMGIVTVFIYLFKKNVYYVFSIHMLNNLFAQITIWLL